ncbi:MAG: hypothetical protein HY270_18695 [Deltaproteobacteria bacterium]|nr:hypothetical protein [Deltaproteobacteria bacterium]
MAWALAVAVGLTAFHFWSSRECLHAFFHFDDFWVLATADRIRISSIADIAKFFEPIHGLVLYRPLSTLGYFYLLRQIFDYQPLGYHVVQIGFHVVTGLLVYLLADKILQSPWRAATVALVYATAPGHAIATCWNALFTMTGAAVWYFAALLVWLGSDRRWRIPAVLLLFFLALLSSEHGASLPMALTLASAVLLQHPWRRIVGEQAPFYLLLGAYVGAKAYYVAFLLERAFPDPLQRAVVRQGYALNFDPLAITRNLGRYGGFALDALYAIPLTDGLAVAIGSGLLCAAFFGTVLVLVQPWRQQALRAAVFGIDLFIVALGPVLILQNHLFSYYVGIAAAGLSICLIALTRLFAPLVRVGAIVAGFVCLALHFGVTADQVRQSEEFRLFWGFTRSAAQWLYSVDAVALPGTVDEVVVPSDSVTQMVFDVGRGHEIFLCARYKVRTTRAVESEPSAPRRVILSRSLGSYPDLSRGWPWLRPCRR